MYLKMKDKIITQGLLGGGISGRGSGGERVKEGEYGPM
jgi:hypothetical protein